MSLKTLAAALTIGFAGWSPPALAQGSEPSVKVWLDDEHAVTYRARIEAGWLIVEVEHEPGWHTYAMDNVARAREKTGKPEPETELPTAITPRGGLTLSGEWRQSPPIDLSTPEIRWFTWGFEGLSYFAAPIHESPEAPFVEIDAQACTESLCAMVEALEVPVVSRETERPSVRPESLAIVANDERPH